VPAPAYLTVDEFTVRSVVPPELVAALETAQPGWILAQLQQWSRWIDMRLSKRYAVPFDAPYPEAVQAWLTRIVTREFYRRRGVDPSDEQQSSILKSGDDAEAEVKEAADAQVGLIDIPSVPNGPSKGSIITRGATRCYSETSPYVALDMQRTRGRNEDRNRRGSGS
jgi:hypothetical protein